MSISPPRYTQVPNEFLDNLNSFSKSEIVILMTLCRLTFGYHKEKAVASNAYIANMCGMAASTVIRNTKSLAAKGIINHEIDSSGYSVWSINISGSSEMKKEPKSTRQKPQPSAASSGNQYAKAKALASVCQMDFESNKGILFGFAKRLPLSAEEIIDLFGPGGAWYRLDFRGKKGSPPVLKQVTTEFLKLQQAEISGEQSLDAPSNSIIKNGELFA